MWQTRQVGEADGPVDIRREQAEGYVVAGNEFSRIVVVLLKLSPDYLQVFQFSTPPDNLVQVVIM